MLHAWSRLHVFAFALQKPEPLHEQTMLYACTGGKCVSVCIYRTSFKYLILANAWQESESYTHSMDEQTIHLGDHASPSLQQGRAKVIEWKKTQCSSWKVSCLHDHFQYLLMKQKRENRHISVHLKKAERMDGSTQIKEFVRTHLGKLQFSSIGTSTSIGICPEANL